MDTFLNHPPILAVDLTAGNVACFLAAQAVATMLLLLLMGAIVWRSRSASTAANKRMNTRDSARGRKLDSPSRSYTLEAKLAAGDLCDVHLASSGGEACVLKIPRDAREPSLSAKEFNLLEELIAASGDDPYRRYLPQPVETFHNRGRRINVFRFREGCYTAEQIRARHPAGVDGRHVAWMFRRTLELLGFVHQHGWLHGAVLPPHLMFDVASHGLLLVGWIHAERLNRPLKFAPSRFKHWYPPECAARRPASAAVDIYLAAKSMVYLAGGDPRSKRMPGHVPDELRRFIESCLLDSPHLRPHDAWELHEELTDVLEGIYGPPEFHELHMS